MSSSIQRSDGHQQLSYKTIRRAFTKLGLPSLKQDAFNRFPFCVLQLYLHCTSNPTDVPHLELSKQLILLSNEYSTKCSELDRRHQSALTQFTTLTSQYLQVIKSLSDSEENVSHCYAQITSLSGEVAEVNKQIQENDVQISDHKVLCTTLTSQLEALRLVMETKNERIITQDQYTNDLRAEIEYLQDENQLLESNIAVLQSENAKLKRSFEEAFEVVSPTTPGTGTSSEEKESENDIASPLQEDDTTPPPSPATQSRIELLNLNSESEEEQLDDNQSSTSSLPSLVSVKMELAPVPVKPDPDN